MPASEAAIRIIAGAALVFLFVLLAWAVAGLPPAAYGIAPLVQQHMSESGVANPVTAVLLNFRGYDTLLEIAVLLLALIGVSALRGDSQAHTVPLPDAGPVLQSFARVLVPVMLIVAGYFLWAGASGPGGAFQAAAVLAGAGLLAALAGLAPVADLDGWCWRVVVVAGFGLFLFTAAVLLVTEGRLLQYPPARSGALILLIEVGLTMSLGLMLFVFFTAGRGHGK